MGDLSPEILRELQRQRDEVLSWISQLALPTAAEIARVTRGLSPEEIGRLTSVSLPSTETIAKLIAGLNTGGVASPAPSTPIDTQKSYEQVERECADYFARTLLSLTDRERVQLLLMVQQIFLAIIHPDQPAAPVPPES